MGIRLLYREGKPPDRDKVHALLVESSGDYAPSMDGERRTRQLRYLMKKGRSLLAFSHGELIGYATFRAYSPSFARRHPTLPPERFAGYGYMSNLLIARRHRGKGFGRRLRERVILRMRKSGFAGAVCTCWARNERMIALNHRMGFREIARVPAPQRGKGEETLVWEKRFRKSAAHGAHEKQK